ncbi:MAG: GAF domain-containing protein [Methanobacterium sp.]|nr:GAF domain-containing protein [Methanobacterium sp.]
MKNNEQRELEKSEYGQGSGKKLISKDIDDIRTCVSGMLESSSFKAISDLIMDDAKKLTASENCYLAYVDPVNKDSVGISFSHMTGECQMYSEIGEARFKIRNDGTYGGLLGYSLDTGESFFIHNPSLHPAAHGLPQGHVPVNEFLSVPAKYDENIIGQIVLGNPENSYTSLDVDLTDALADIYALAIHNFLYKKK